MRHLAVWVLLAACSGSEEHSIDAVNDESDTDTDTDADADADADADSDADTDTGTTDAQAVTGVSARLHDGMRSLFYVSWTQSLPGSAHVEVSFDPGVWEIGPSHDWAAGTHEQIVVGVPFDTTADWRVVVDGADPVDGTPITTGPIPAGLPIGDVTVSDPSSWDPDHRYLLTSINQDPGGWTSGHYWTFIIDREGRPVWAHLAPNRHWTLFPQVSVTGDYLLWDESAVNSSFPPDPDSKIHYTWLDEEFDVRIALGQHHAFVQLPDGTLAWGSQAVYGREQLMVMGPKETTPTVLWSCRDGLPGIMNEICISNGLFYDATTDHFLYSHYTSDTLVEIDHATGETVWYAGETPGGYSFDPPSSQFYWQHGVSYTDAHTLLVSSENDVPGPERYGTFLLEYEVDQTNHTLHNVWANYAKAHAGTNGQAWRLSDGHTLHLVGSASVVREVDETGTDVWRVEYGGQVCRDPDNCLLLGEGQFVADLYALTRPIE